MNRYEDVTSLITDAEYKEHLKTRLMGVWNEMTPFQCDKIEELIKELKEDIKNGNTYE